MIFADSSYFIAIVNEKDQWHRRAIEILKKIDDDLVVTDLIISESVTSVGSIGGGKAGLKVYNYITDNCQVTFADKATLDRAMRIYLMYDGTLSLADAVSLIVMEDYGIKTILSFDSDFDRVKGMTRLA